MSGKEAATSAPDAAAQDAEFCAGVVEIKAKNFATVCKTCLCFCLLSHEQAARGAAETVSAADVTAPITSRRQKSWEGCLSGSSTSTASSRPNAPTSTCRCPSLWSCCPASRRALLWRRPAAAVAAAAATEKRRRRVSGSMFCNSSDGFAALCFLGRTGARSAHFSRARAKRSLRRASAAAVALLRHEKLQF